MYELDVEFKESTIPTLKPTLYTESVGRSLLKPLVFIGNFEYIKLDVTLETLTSADREAYLKILVQNKDKVYDPMRLRE